MSALFTLSTDVSASIARSSSKEELERTTDLSNAERRRQVILYEEPHVLALGHVSAQHLQQLFIQNKVMIALSGDTN
jgi:hypothetical protein